MKKRYILTAVVLPFLIWMGVWLGSCEIDNSEPIEEEGKVTVESFQYEMNRNDSSVPNELSYQLSFEIDFSNESKIDNHLSIIIEGKKANFTIDYSNTEDVSLGKDEYSKPGAVLNYALPPEIKTIHTEVKLKITTTDLIDDVNQFLAIHLYVANGTILDPKDFSDDRILKMNYSDSSGAIFYEFNEFSESYKLISVITNDKSFEVPEIYQNFPVKEIAEGAFSASTDIENLILPKTLISLPKGLLKDMTSLKSLTIPFLGSSLNDTEQNYLGYLFGTSNYFEFVSSSLKEVTLLGGKAIGEGAFYKCSIEKIELPNGITSIGGHAFESCHLLKSIKLPGSVTSIGDYAFSGCSSLTSAVLGEGLESIGERAFDGCESLSSVTMGTNVSSIGTYAFGECKSLTSITIPDGITKIEMGAFYLCQTLTSIQIPDGVTSIGDVAFWQCSSLTSVILGKNVEFIDSQAFEFCWSLQSIILNDALDRIGKDAFRNCMQLKEVYYMGSPSDWNYNVDIDESNDSILSKAIIYYYKEVEPSESGNYWHYVDGVATKW